MNPFEARATNLILLYTILNQMLVMIESVANQIA